MHQTIIWNRNTRPSYWPRQSTKLIYIHVLIDLSARSQKDCSNANACFQDSLYLLHLITADFTEKTTMYLTANILHQWNISWRTDVVLLGLSVHSGLNYDLRYTNESLPVGEASEYAIERTIYYRAFKHNKIK